MHAETRLILDIGGSRQTREAELGAMVDRAVERLEAGAEAASLPPMSSYERKLVHDIVAARADWTSGSARFPAVPGDPDDRLPAPPMPTVRLRPRGPRR